MLSEPNK